MSVFLPVLFALVGAHIPKAFSVLYLALILSSFLSLRRHGDVDHHAGSQRLFLLILVLLLIFSVSYPFAMLRYGFWQWSGRQALDVISALLLPSWLLWWGRRWMRCDSRQLQIWLLSYAVGALLFLVASMFKTYGFHWWTPNADRFTIFLAWGNEVSMNIRSVEQNGILAVALAPLSVWLFLRRRWAAALFILGFSAIGWMAVVGQGGRLWIPSLILATLPVLFSRLLFPMASAWQLRFSAARFFIAFSVVVAAATLVFASNAMVHWLPRLQYALCDERFSMYVNAFRHWPQLIAGGRLLHFDFLPCEGQVFQSYSAAGAFGSVTLMHNVLLDVMVSVGIWVALPLVLVAVIAIPLAVRYLFCFTFGSIKGESVLSRQILWSFLAVLIPQWLFQPLLYGDGLLFYLSFALLGCLLAWPNDFLLPSRRRDAVETPLN